VTFQEQAFLTLLQEPTVEATVGPVIPVKDSREENMYLWWEESLLLLLRLLTLELQSLLIVVPILTI
jgi:hypothetical protein